MTGCGPEPSDPSLPCNDVSCTEALKAICRNGNRNPCQPCNNTCDGCMPGFEPVAFNICANINDCLNDHKCQNGICRDGYGGINNYTCECYAGYSGKFCNMTNACLSQPCKNNGTCVDLPDGFRCDCKTGYTGTLCETNPNDCAGNPCKNGATCVDGLNSYTCTCTPYFTGTNCSSCKIGCRPGPFPGVCIDPTCTADRYKSKRRNSVPAWMCG
eukprot:g122.t1